MIPKKIYLGDGAYAELREDADGFRTLILTTENGIEAQNTIVLEATEATQLLEFLRSHQYPRP